LEVLGEFHRLRKAGVKMSPALIVSMAKYILDKSQHPIYLSNTILPGKTKCLGDLVTHRWVQSFQDRLNIVYRRQAGKKQLSPEKEIFIQKEVAYHMGVLKRGFESGEFVDGCMENMDETHFIMDMENGKTLAFSGDKDIEYADVVSASTGMTMMVKVTSNRIGTPMMVFINDDPIRGVPDKTEG
jgi:hypothetical protein